jgi:probable rRNA maturation factor
MKRGNSKSRVLISSSQRAVRVNRPRLTRLMEFVARAEGCRLGQIDLALVGSREIASHNSRWLGHAGATDVLSFDLSGAGAGPGKVGGGMSGAGGGLCGQLIVCGEVAAEQARLRGLPAQEELMLYVVHGLLHLMSYDDRTVRGAARMHAREEEILRDFLASTKPKARPRAQPAGRTKARSEAPSSKSQIPNKRQGPKSK